MAINTAYNKNNPGLRNLRYFEGFYQPHYKDKFVNGNAFIFMTKPKLFLNPYKPNDNADASEFLSYDNMCKDPFFTLFLNGETFNDMDKEILLNLSYKANDPDYTDRKSNFIKLITNEAKNFDPIDVNLDTLSDAFTTKQGYTMPLPTNSTTSRGSATLALQFDETLNLDITKLFTLWVKYIENVVDGTFRANPDSIALGELDYMCSIYYFVLGPDGKTLKYWSRYTGCYPTAIPYGTFNYAKGDRVISNVSVPITYILKEDMNPQILEDFNRVALDQVYFDYTSDNTDFDSFRESPLLSYRKLTQGTLSSLVTNEARDPLVFFKERSAELIGSSDAFELSFAPVDIEQPYYTDRFDEYDFEIYED
jgi:hypothetical protein